jgi:hypothetical protein
MFKCLACDTNVGNRRGIPDARSDWFVKVWKYDIPKENRAAVADAAREKRELAEYFANHKRGDRLLESLVAAGAPSCILFGPKDERRDSRRR